MRHNNLTVLPSLIEDLQLPFKKKLKNSMSLIKRTISEFPQEKIVVSFGGGKDSLIVLYLVKKFINPKVVFLDTGVQYPETYSYIDKLEKEWNLDLVRLKPYKKTFWEIVDEYGLPKSKHNENSPAGRNFCHYYLKFMPFKHAVKKYNWACNFDGVTAWESRIRMWTAFNFGDYFYNHKIGIQTCRPILYWTEKEVWDYIKRENLPVNPLYEKGAERVGCMPCTAFKDWKKQLSKCNPEMYRKVMRLKGQELLI